MSRKTSGKFPQPQKPILSMQKCCWLHEPAKTNKGGKTHTEESQIGVTQASICVKAEEAEEWKQRRTLRYARTPTYLNILVIRKGVPALSPHNFGHTTKKNTSLWFGILFIQVTKNISQWPSLSSWHGFPPHKSTAVLSKAALCLALLINPIILVV